MPLRWELRWHPLREEWVVVAAHRQDRPWTGEVIGGEKPEPPKYDPACYLCPGNRRASGECNDMYEQTFVFDNDFPCVGPDAPTHITQPPRPYASRPARGYARVVCFHPKHNLTLAQMTQQEIEQVLIVWQQQYLQLGSMSDINHVLIFENKGEVVGVSNPHPHGQIYATPFVSRIVEIEAAASERYLRDTGRLLFGDILDIERADGNRVVVENEHGIAFIPYFARYAYEAYVSPKIHRRDIAEMTPKERADLAAVLRSLLVRYDNLWKMSFPYIMALHNRPTDGASHEAFWFHIEIHPPLRKPNLLKYLGGAETGGGNFLTDTWPDEKAQELREQSEVHYRRRNG